MMSSQSNPTPAASTNWRITRRHVLRGLGVGLVLPLLDCMRPAMAADAREANQDAESAAPRRFVAVYLPNGVNTLDYQILDDGKGYTFSRSLRPLERHRDVITPISGLHHPHALGHHHGCQSIWLTGAKIGATERNSVSLDQFIAERTAVHTRVRSLELSDTGRSLSYNADGITQPATTRPSEVFRRLFKQPDGGLETQRAALAERGSILDAVLQPAASLRKAIGREDRVRLDQYLQSVREVEIRTQRADRWLDVPLPAIEDRDRRRLTRSVDQTDTGDYLRTMYDLIVLAFQTDMTRVATFSSGDEGKGLPIKEIGINQTRHALSHHNGDPVNLARLTQSDTFNFEQFAYFLDRLSETSDAEGPLLDTTVALDGSGMAYGHSHGNANVPTIVAGGRTLGLRHGRHLDLNRETDAFTGYALGPDGGLDSRHYQLCSRPINPDARMSDLLLTLAQAVGVDVDRFADSGGTLSALTT